MAKLRYTITIETPFNPENYEGMGITTAEAAAAQEERFFEEGGIDLHDLIEFCPVTGLKVEAVDG